MAKNKQTCVKCNKKIEGEYRMQLMNGPKGFRRYAVHVECPSKSAKHLVVLKSEDTCSHGMEVK